MLHWQQASFHAQRFTASWLLCMRIEDETAWVDHSLQTMGWWKKGAVNVFWLTGFLIHFFNNLHFKIEWSITFLKLTFSVLLHEVYSIYVSWVSLDRNPAYCFPTLIFTRKKKSRRVVLKRQNLAYDIRGHMTVAKVIKIICF